VTGAGRGIGAAVAAAFIDEGADVVGLDVVYPSTTTLDESRAMVCDVSVRSQVIGAIGDAVELMGGLDGLVNVAGIERRVAAQDITEDEWDEMLDIHLRGTFVTNQVAFGHLNASGGRIINFGSHSGLTAHPHGAHYSAAKGGVIAWTRTVAQEWGPYGITANCVLPAIATPMYEEYRAQRSPEELREHDERMAQQIPIGGRLGDARLDLAPVLVFLASDASHFVTGQLIAITGGYGTTR